MGTHIIEQEMSSYEDSSEAQEEEDSARQEYQERDSGSENEDFDEDLDYGDPKDPAGLVGRDSLPRRSITRGENPFFMDRKNTSNSETTVSPVIGD